MQFAQSLGISLDPLVRDFGTLAVAFLIAFPIGWERGHGHRSVGFRTLPIVAMAACGFSLILNLAGAPDLEARARIMQGVITGIGFIGGGAIVKTRGTVKGLVTAASIWNAGAIGLATGMGRTNIAIALSMLNFLSLVVLGRFVTREEQEESAKEERERNT